MKAVSRTAWENFIKCKRCFYLERKLKIKSIGTPGHPINSRVDALLKNEFDYTSKIAIVAKDCTDKLNQRMDDMIPQFKSQLINI